MGRTLSPEPAGHAVPSNLASSGPAPGRHPERGRRDRERAGPPELVALVARVATRTAETPIRATAPNAAKAAGGPMYGASAAITTAVRAEHGVSLMTTVAIERWWRRPLVTGGHGLPLEGALAGWLAAGPTAGRCVLPRISASIHI